VAHFVTLSGTLLEDALVMSMVRTDIDTTVDVKILIENLKEKRWDQRKLTRICTNVYSIAL